MKINIFGGVLNMIIKLTEAAAGEARKFMEESEQKYLRISALYLEGTTLDYYNDISKRGFVFDNPNTVKSCGCGNSFQV